MIQHKSLHSTAQTETFSQMHCVKIRQGRDWNAKQMEETTERMSAVRDEILYD